MNFKTFTSILLIAICLTIAYGGAVVNIKGNQGSVVVVDTPKIDIESDAASKQKVNQKVDNPTYTMTSKSKTSDSDDIDVDAGKTSIDIDNNTKGSAKSKVSSTKVTTKK